MAWIPHNLNGLTSPRSKYSSTPHSEACYATRCRNGNGLGPQSPTASQRGAPLSGKPRIPRNHAPRGVRGGWRPTNAFLDCPRGASEGLPSSRFSRLRGHTGPARVIEMLGGHDQKKRWLPPIATGESTMAAAISEPQAGSAATDRQTTAQLVGDHYLVNGTKRWCSGAGHAGLYLVYVRLSGEPGAAGIGALVVERNTPGLTFGRREDLMGFRSVPSADMTFLDAKVPADQLVV
jgi:butyryl-CoA dehydrogenase